MGIPLEHHEFLYDTYAKYWSKKKKTHHYKFRWKFPEVSLPTQQIYKYNKLLFDAFLLFANLHHFLICAHTFSV